MSDNFYFSVYRAPSSSRFEIIPYVCFSQTGYDLANEVKEAELYKVSCKLAHEKRPDLAQKMIGYFPLDKMLNGEFTDSDRENLDLIVANFLKN